MKRVILIFAAVLLASIGWSQTMNIHYKNGQTVQYNMNNIDYVEYTEDNPNNAQVSSGEAVDLGLSVLWASCNVGATSPEQYGNKYAWGETETKDSFKLSNYLYYDSSSDSYTDIGLDIGGTDYDVAYVKWGGNWRIPNKEEFSELRNKCSWEWTLINDVKGYKVTGTNGNSIFLPVIYTNRYWLSFWTSTIWTSVLKGNASDACYFSLTNGSAFGAGGLRWEGRYIRPVKSK